MRLIFPRGREHTGSLAFTNCFKLERVNGPSCIVLWVGKASVKEALTLFIDFFLAAWICSTVPSSWDSFSSLSLSLSYLCLNSLLSWFILAIQCARHENLYIYHTPVWMLGYDISKLFFPYTFIIHFFFQKETLWIETDWRWPNISAIVFHVLHVVNGVETGAVLWFNPYQQPSQMQPLAASSTSGIRERFRRIKATELAGQEEGSLIWEAKAMHTSKVK